MLEFLLAAALLTAPTPAQNPGQDPAAPPPQDAPVTLEEVTVTGRPLDRLIQDFVSGVAEPNGRRGLARWNDQICVGVANLRPEAAEYLADRISTVAEDLGLNPDAPGCTPNILVIATDDGEALARALVAERPRAFRMGGAGMDRGGDALEDFIETDRPVRWWQMAMPIDSETGQRATRIPGECLRPPCLSASDYAPIIPVFAASRLHTQIVDRLSRALVIVDVDEVSHLSVLQLADYIAMVSLAQIDPDADTRAYASILNVMDDPTTADSLMDWDVAYLEGLYASEGDSLNRRANREELIDAIRGAHRDLRANQAEEVEGGEGAAD